MTSFNLDQLLDEMKNTSAMQSKMNIGHNLNPTATHIQQFSDLYALPGDDTAAIKMNDGYLLHACEGMIPSFVENTPYFAGWSAVMANISDIAAMGGRATSVVNSFWHRSYEQAQLLMQGMQDACAQYAVPMVGGHTHIDPSFQPALSVAIQGQAKKLLSVMHVQPQHDILLVLNMKGKFHPNSTYWKCFEGVKATTLQNQLEILPQLAELGLVEAARDISNAGILGSLLMLLEASGCGAEISLDQIMKPEAVTWSHWLKIFPSYGFLLTAERAASHEIMAHFAEQNLHCVVIGRVNESGVVTVRHQQQQAEFWNFKQQLFTGLCYAEQLQHIQQQTQRIPTQIRQGEQSRCQA